MYFVKDGDICIRYIGTEKWDERELPDLFHGSGLLAGC